MSPRVCFLSVLSLVAIPLLTLAQAPTPKHSLSLEVRSIAAGGSRTNSGNAYVSQDSNMVPAPSSSMTTSSFNRTSRTSSSTTIQIDIRNLARNPDEVTVEWYFLAKVVDSFTQDLYGWSKDKMIYDRGSSTLTIEPVITKKLEVSSKPLTRTNTEQQSTRMQQTAPGQFQRFYSGVKSKHGAKPAGWIVRLVSNEQVLAVRASDPAMEGIAKDSNQLSRLIPVGSAHIVNDTAGLNRP